MNAEFLLKQARQVLRESISPECPGYARLAYLIEDAERRARGDRQRLEQIDYVANFDHSANARGDGFFISADGLEFRGQVSLPSPRVLKRALLADTPPIFTDPQDRQEWRTRVYRLVEYRGRYPVYREVPEK